MKNENDEMGRRRNALRFVRPNTIALSFHSLPLLFSSCSLFSLSLFSSLPQSSLHFSNTGVNKPLVNMQHYHQVTKNSSLVAKMITDLGLSRSMAAAGYKVSFPNTATDVLGMADTYGGVRIRVDREMMRDMKASFFLHYNATATATGKDVADDPNAFGIKVTIGKQPTFDPSLSPCTMNRVQFRIQ